MFEADFAIAVFPFLKTSSSIKLGGYTFRSTGDVEGLPTEQAKAVKEIASMLFVHNDMRVKSASYAILPALEFYSNDHRVRQLARLRDVVAYFYAAPRGVFDDVFLPPEEVSLVMFAPVPVSVFLTRPDHHTKSEVPASAPEPDASHNVPGYAGLYNFRHAFWIEPGSRLYGPKPHMTLNLSQDLGVDFDSRIAAQPYNRILLKLLERPDTPAALRIYSALHWFNAANGHALDQSQAIMNLAIAFETLLRLPESSKTDRLVDAISLLLGRTERLDVWAEQFYAARSRVVHEGEVDDGYFYAPGSGKRQFSDAFGSLMLYGRQVFQFCVSTLLVGIDLAERAELQESFVTNNERYQKVCKLLSSEAGTPAERLLAIAPIITMLKKHQFVASGIDSDLMLGSVRLAAEALVACDQELGEELRIAVKGCADSKSKDGEYQRLGAIKELKASFMKLEISTLTNEARVVHELSALVWSSLFLRYFQLDNLAKGST